MNEIDLELMYEKELVIKFIEKLDYSYNYKTTNERDNIIKDICDIAGIEQLTIPVVSVRKIVRCEDPMICLRGCSVHKQTCKHPIYER